MIIFVKLRKDLEDEICKLLPELEAAAKSIFKNDHEDILQDVIITTLQRDEEFICRLVEIGQLKYYMFKALWFQKYKIVRDAEVENRMFKSYMTNHVVFYNSQPTYSMKEIDMMNNAIDELPFVQQKLIKYYLASGGNSSKLAREIALNTDGVGIPKTMVARIIREAKKKIKEKINENNGSITS